MDTKSTDKDKNNKEPIVKEKFYNVKNIVWAFRKKLTFVSPYILIIMCIAGLMCFKYGNDFEIMEGRLKRVPERRVRTTFYKDQWLSESASSLSTKIYKETDYLNHFEDFTQIQLNDIGSKLSTDNNTKFLIYNRKNKKVLTNIDTLLSTLVSNSDAKSVEDVINKNLYRGDNIEDKLKNMARDSVDNSTLTICLTSAASPAVQNFEDHLKYIKNPQDYLEIFYATREGVSEYSRSNTEIVNYDENLGWSDAQNLWDKQQEWKIVVIFCAIFLIVVGIKNTLNELKVCAVTKVIIKFRNNVSKFFSAKTLAYKYIGFLIFSILAVISSILALLTNIHDGNIFTAIAIIIPAIYIFYILPKTFKFIINLNNIVKGTESIVNGNLEYSLEEDRIDGNLQKLSKSINSLKKGFKVSIDEQIKNEKLKSELVANVSHDLKTPLTSIINYTDILMREGLTEEEKGEYIQILNRKSLKLKDLIEALFEVSKINSGKIELEKKEVNVVELLNQSIGELATSAEEKGLKFKLNTFNHEVIMNLDGKKMARVFENLISNAIKYSMENTRVFVEVEEQTQGIRIAFKNIASYDMDFDINEIFERFTRADKSRNSNIEGNGLGLAIAKSIVELHGGNIAIDKDGDMFKVFIMLNM